MSVKSEILETINLEPDVEAEFIWDINGYFIVLTQDDNYVEISLGKNEDEARAQWLLFSSFGMANKEEEEENGS